MTDAPVQATLLSVGEIAEADVSYVVPIYQRNYAWREEQIEQLVDDVWTAAQDAAQDQYFLGNLVVAEAPALGAHGTGRALEVIDGQQRLTTLLLLLHALGDAHPAPPLGLRYASRPKATAALANLGSSDDEDGTGIPTAYKIVRQVLDARVGAPNRFRFSAFLRGNVRLVRATLDSRTDRNRYFEIMNTRGQQLQQVDIVKARLMRHLVHDAQSQECFAWIWDACRDMDAYVQMTLTRVPDGRRAALRGRIFGDGWDRLKVGHFAVMQTLHEQHVAAPDPVAADDADRRSLREALAAYAGAAPPDEADDVQSARFRSPVTFSSFLLHVLKVHDAAAGADDGSAEDDTDEGRLDDNKLIKLFDQQFGRLSGASAVQAVKRFAEQLLRCRFIFDNYVLKREHTGTNGDDGDWSLKRLVRSASDGNRAAYPASFAAPDSPDDAEDPSTAQVLMLQSMLRVTYTSPRTMHWITAVLRMQLEQDGPTSASPVLATLEAFARKRVRNAFFGTEEPTGFAIERIVFTYLDYLIAKGSDPGYRFGFRNSVEHFFPQCPDTDQAGAFVIPSGLHSFGNLALISVGTNSKFSNNMPDVKRTFTRLVQLSPKLLAMAADAARTTWDDRAISAHREAMVRLLREDLGLAPAPAPATGSRPPNSASARHAV